MPSDMTMLCAKVKVRAIAFLFLLALNSIYYPFYQLQIYKNDGMPGVICNNCIYRLGVAYHFKQQAENSDLRLRQYFGLMDKAYGTRDAEVNTDELPFMKKQQQQQVDKNTYSNEEEEEEDQTATEKKKTK